MLAIRQVPCLGKINNSEVGFYASSVRRLGSRHETKRESREVRPYDILSAPVATDEYISCVEGSGSHACLIVKVLFIATVLHNIGGVFFMEFCSREAFCFKDQLRQMRQPLSLCLCGLFIALYVALSFFSIKLTEFLEFRFAFLALIAAAAYGGPIMGMCAGIAGDVISYFVAPQTGPFFPGFTLTYALLGFGFGLLLYRSKITPVRAALASLVDYVLAITLSTFWLYIMYDMPLEYLFTVRLLKCTISLVINTVLIYVFMKAFQRIMATALPSMRDAKS